MISLRGRHTQASPYPFLSRHKSIGMFVKSNFCYKTFYKGRKSLKISDATNYHEVTLCLGYETNLLPEFSPSSALKIQYANFHQRDVSKWRPPTPEWTNFNLRLERCLEMIVTHALPTLRTEPPVVQRETEHQTGRRANLKIFSLLPSKEKNFEN